MHGVGDIPFPPAARALYMRCEPKGGPRPGPGLGRLPPLGRDRRARASPGESGHGSPGTEAAGDVPSCVILCASGHESLSERVQFYRELCPDPPPIVVFGPQLDLPLARDALRAGASGFVHAEMTPDQLVRAVTVAARGELVAPRELLRYVLTEDQSGDLAALSARQREILGYVVEGLSNAEIGRRLYLSESTIKQHLRSAYKLLGVSNRTEAANLFRRAD